MPSITSLLHFIPDGLEWNGKEEGVFDEWLSYFVLFTDRISYAITGSHPHFILSTPKNRRPKTANRYLRISFEYLLELLYSLIEMDWNGMERKRASLLNGFFTLFYLPIDLAML